MRRVEPYKPKHLDPNPRMEREAMTGVNMTVPFAWLAGHMIDSLTIDDSRLVSVDRRIEASDELLHVTCTDDRGEEHMFVYDPFDDVAPVDHVRLGKPSAE